MDKYIQALLKIYGKERTLEDIKEDYKNDYLTENKGRNGKDHLWYKDETKDICIELETGKELTEKEKEEQFY